MVEATLNKDKATVWDREQAKAIFEGGYFGKLREDRLELSLLETLYLIEKEVVEIKDEDVNEVRKANTVSAKAETKLSAAKLRQLASSIDNRFDVRYAVYKDLRDRELPVRTGFKFGCDFRVYGKGVKPLKRGPKSAGEHTKWIVFAVQEGFTFSFPELSRAVRLAHNIRANMLWAVVGEKGDIQYYQVQFFKP